MVKAGMIMAGLLGTAATAFAGDCTPGTGASLAWTSQDPVVAEARALINKGALKEAESLLDSNAQAPGADAARAREETREIIRRIRREFAQDIDGLVAKLTNAIPDVTAADVDRWRAQGDVICRELDGRIMYFIREPGGILRFSSEAKERRDKHAAQTGAVAAAARGTDNKLHGHLQQVIEAARKTGKTEVLPIRHRIEYSLTVKPDRPGAKAGSLVRCWLPFPQEYRQQKDVKLIRTSPAEHTVAPNAVDSGCIGGAPQRTVYMERKIDDPSKPVVFEEAFEYVSYAYYPQLSDEQAKPQRGSVDPIYLAERPPHIVFTPEIKAAVDRLVGDEKNPLARARRIFHYISEEMRWCPEMEYAIIPCCAQKLFTAKRGDCGVHAILFITMCRYAGIPARWQSGWESKPEDWNMHDWAEFHVEPWGWLPADPSYGLQKSDDPEIREFYLGHQDSYRLIGNLDYGAELHPPKPTLRSEPADFQRGEVELDGRNLYFDDWTYDIKFEWEPMQE